MKKTFETNQEQPRRRNKLGEWLDSHRGGVLDYVDWKAALK